jgi:putative DNA primase/helicase
MLWISIGKTRFDIKWKPVEITWQDLIKKLQKPVITSETINEYIKASKDRQTEIKDVGGYVGGVISGGNRIAKNVQSRSLITLDIDKPSEDFWDDFQLTWTCTAVLHATHSSYKGHLRYRLIIPLSHDVHTDEYEAIARWIAGSLNIELFDPTTFQPERLMYWPSVCSNADYLFYYQPGKALNPESVLKNYQDWHDISQWPVHEKVDKLIRKEITKQEDPLQKPGIIGAFCRTYTISEVIEKYLHDVYEPAGENRYTYKQGSTAGGLIIYDDKFAYSHHATDPVGNKLVNAFDLVRLSLYPEADKNIQENTNTTKYPSYIKTTDLITKDGAVKKHMMSEKFEEAKADFGDYIETGSEEELEWTKKLDVDKKGDCYSTTQNIVIILENDPKLKNKFRWDDFNKRQVFADNTFWKKLKRITDAWVTDADLAHLRHYLETVYNISSGNKVEDALTVVTIRHKFHPVIDYLKSTEWDGKERAENLLIDYLGVDDNQYNRDITRKTLVAAVSRIFEPGCKYDCMLMLFGEQGQGKSELFKRLGGDWFSDTLGSLQNKDALEQLHGVWIMEMAELEGLKKAEVETVKQFISKQVDRFRVAWGKKTEAFPRQNIFIGTTNEDEPLKDQTGNRRFWPAKCDISKAIKDVFKMSAAERDQIWAEAVVMYTLGEDLYLTGETLVQSKLIQESFTEQEVYTNVIRQYLNIQLPKAWYSLDHYDRLEYLNNPNDNTIGKPEVKRYKVTIEEIWKECIRGQIKDLNKFTIKSIKNSMRKMKGWDYRMIKGPDGSSERGFYNQENATISEKFISKQV